jgi:hypothetical protein
MKLGLALSLAKAKEVGGAPAGIPISSTQFLSINIPGNANGFGGIDGVFGKKVPQQVLISHGGPNLYINIAGACYVWQSGTSILFSPNAQAWNDLNLGDPQFGTPFGTWKIGEVNYDGENDAWSFTERASNPSTNANFIPQTGWSPSQTTATKFSPTYISRIVITGSSSPNFNGTYNASIVPGYGNEYSDRVDTYGFNGPSGVALNWNSGEPRFELYADGSGATGGFGSGDGITWSAIESYISVIDVGGFDAIYYDANGLYYALSPNPNRWNHQYGGFYIENGTLWNDSEEPIANNNNSYAGSWTPANYISSVTLTGSGSPVADGNYLRQDTQVSMREVPFNGPESTYIYYNAGEWIVFDTIQEAQLYLGNADLTDWTTLSGDPNAPTASVGSVARSIGSVTSSVIYVPSGSISGSITTTAI